MSTTIETRRTPQISLVDNYLSIWIEAFLVDRKAGGAAVGTLLFYRTKLRLFTTYCEAQAVTQITQIAPTLIRQYLLYLEEAGYRPGGRHAAFRTLRAFLYWYENENEPEGWTNPIRKVKAPKVPSEPLEPVPLETVTRMVRACEKGTFAGDRDSAMLLFLLDTGARAREFLDINLEDVNQARGDILIRQGKEGNREQFISAGCQGGHCGGIWLIAETIPPRCG